MLDQEQKLGEIYMENIHLRETLAEVEGSRVQLDQCSEKSVDGNRRCPFKLQTAFPVAICVILAGSFIAYSFYNTILTREIFASLGSKSRSPLLGALTGSGNGAGNHVQKGYLNIGMRQDYLLQECQGTQYKQSFPDLDYSLLGYNVLKGFPLSIGHDPGFTYPIFVADYSDGRQTADCRYSIPRGLTVIPDVSCEISFSSTVAQTKYEFATSLSTSANIGGGGWGVHFSASAGYKTSSSEISTGEFVYIISSATCSYYFSKLVKRQSPVFHPVFLEWVHTLDKSDNKSIYLEFFDVYGTHFLTDVTFGARFTHEYKMQSQLYEKKKESNVDVGVQASYSGMFSVSGGFGMSFSDRQAASEFSKSVQTKTITTGAAPPSNGDAMTWASTVQNSPVPIKYSLESIEQLFTTDYMPDVSVNKSAIISNIIKYKYDYCLSLKKKGLVNSCEKLTPGINLDARLMHHYQSTPASLSECIDHCLKQIHCSAITYCSSCAPTSIDYKTCYMYREDKAGVSVHSESTNWESYIFLEKVKRLFEFGDTAVIGDVRSLEDEADKQANASRCQELCLKDANCVAFSHCDCQDKTVTCELFGANNMKGLKLNQGSKKKTVFVSQRFRLAAETSTTKPTTIKPSTSTRK